MISCESVCPCTARHLTTVSKMPAVGNSKTGWRWLLAISLPVADVMQHVQNKDNPAAADSRNQEKCEGGEGKRKWSEITSWVSLHEKYICISLGKIPKMESIISVTVVVTPVGSLWCDCIHMIKCTSIAWSMWCLNASVLQRSEPFSYCRATFSMVADL